jgi:hypothetical protein
VVCLAGLIGTSAHAQEENASEARRAFDRATKLFEQNKYLEAKEAFELAYRLRPHFRVQCSIARCYQIMGDPIQAVEHYERCLKEGAADSPMKADIEKMLKESKALVAWVDVRSPGGGGTIHVDDVERGAAPRRVPLNPGMHVIKVTRKGAEPAVAKIKVFGGEERDLTLIPIGPEQRGDKLPPPPPPHTDHRRRLSPLWFWTAAGATAALAVGTIVAGVLTHKSRDAYNDDPTKNGLDTFNSRKLATNVLFGMTLAAAAGGTALYFFTDFGGGKERPEDKEAFLLGVGLQGTF